MIASIAKGHGLRRDRVPRTSRILCVACGARDGRVVVRYTRRSDGLQLHVCGAECLQRAAIAAAAPASQPTEPVIW